MNETHAPDLRGAQRLRLREVAVVGDALHDSLIPKCRLPLKIVTVRETLPRAGPVLLHSLVRAK